MLGQGISADSVRFLSISAISDAATALAYFLISLTLAYLIRKRRDLPYPHMFRVVAVIIFACAMSRLVDVWALWHPTHWNTISTVARTATAGASLLVASLLYALVPGVLKLQSPSQLDTELEKLGVIVASSNNAIIRKDLNGVIESWNHAAELLYGYSEAEAVGKNISILVPANCEDEIPSILASIKGGGRIAHYETRRMSKDGRLVDVSLSISPVYEHGKVVGAATIARDISEKLQLIEK